MKKPLLLVLALCLVFALAACGSSSNSEETSSSSPSTPSENTDDSTTEAVQDEITELTMGFVPSRDAEQIADTVEPLQDKLSEALGVPVKAEVMTNYVALIEGMRTKQIDIGFLPPFGFVQAENHSNVEVILKAERRGSVSYQAQYNVRAELEHINSIEDLVAEQGLRWAFPDTGSTSGFLFPGSQLMDLGVTDLNAHFVTRETGGHDAAIVALLNGDADFATTFDDARTVVEGDYPNVMDDIKVIGYTDPIPNDTISLRDGLSQEWKDKIKQAFLSFNDDPATMEIMNEVYQWTGVVEAKSEDYDVVRSTFEKFKDQLSQ